MALTPAERQARHRQKIQANPTANKAARTKDAKRKRNQRNQRAFIAQKIRARDWSRVQTPSSWDETIRIAEREMSRASAGIPVLADPNYGRFRVKSDPRDIEDNSIDPEIRAQEKEAYRAWREARRR